MVQEIRISSPAAMAMLLVSSIPLSGERKIFRSRHAETAKFKHAELICTQGRQVLMVLVMAGGEVSQQILTLAEPVSQERLSQTASRLNGLLAGLAVDVIAALPARADALDQDILSIIVQDMRRATQRVSGDIYTDGLTNMLSEPEFAESDEARRALKIFEERSTLQDLLARTTINSNVGALQVLVGGEGEWEELRQCSIVLARYGVPGLATGTLGVLGPMRMVLLLDPAELLTRAERGLLDTFQAKAERARL